MSGDLPDGFIVDQPSNSAALPQGFTVDSHDPTQFQDNPEPSLDDSRPGFLAGVQRGAANRVLGAAQTINDTGVGKYLGLPNNQDISSALAESQKQGKGTGISGTAGELLGDPVNYIPGGAELKEGKIGLGALGLAGAKQGAVSGFTAPEQQDNGSILNRFKNGVQAMDAGTLAALGFGKIFSKADKGDQLQIGQTGNAGDQAFLNARNIVRGNYLGQKGAENSAWNAAQQSAIGTNIHGEAIAPTIKNSVEQALGQRGQSLADDNLQPLNKMLGKLDKFTPPEPVPNSPVQRDPFSNEPIPQSKPAPYEGVPVGELIAMRKGLSGMAGTSTDGNLRNAAGLALMHFDKSMQDAAQYAVMSGDDKAVDKFMTAINQSKGIFKNFGTGKGEPSTFANIISNNKMDNDQVVSAFGTTARGPNSVSSTITRLLRNAGDQKNSVRENLANGYLYKAINRATQSVNGEDIINPGRMRTELDAILKGNKTAGLGQYTRDLLFSKDDLARIQGLRDNIKDGKNLLGKVSQMAASRVPMAGGIVPSGAIGAGRVARGQVEKYLNPDKAAISMLKGQPYYYGALWAGAPAAESAVNSASQN